jgi:hypothetical protein
VGASEAEGDTDQERGRRAVDVALAVALRSFFFESHDFYLNKSHDFCLNKFQACFVSNFMEVSHIEEDERRILNEASANRERMLEARPPQSYLCVDDS